MKSLKYCSFVCLILFGCAPNNEEEINNAYLLETNPQNYNLDDRKEILSEINNINEFLESENLNGIQDIPPEIRSLINGIESKEVLLIEEVGNLFDPDSLQCPIPSKVHKKLAKLKNNGKRWAPNYVKNHINKLPDTVTFLPSTSVSVLMHSVKIKSVNGRIRNWTVFGAPTFNNLSIDRFILANAFDSFIYSLDCSGYLNAAIEGAAAIPGADIKSSAKSALEKQLSLFIGGGVLVSPFAAAYHGPQQMGIKLDTIERVQILKSLETIPNVVDSDSILVSSSYEVVWASNDGSSSFNGEAGFEGSSNLGFGVARISAGLKAGGQVSRESRYSTFRTYFTHRKRVNELDPFSISDVKEKMKALQPQDG